MPPRFLAPASYYAAIAAAGSHSVVSSVRFNKRDKAVHRTLIADVHGELSLTVPVARPLNSMSARWSDVRVSTHGSWWSPMMTSLESAYGRSPFFEFYIDRFAPFFKPRHADTCEPVTDLDIGLHNVVCDLLLIPHPVDAPAVGAEVVDFIGGDWPSMPLDPYYQVRGAELGFIGGLSIVDMLFNIGPEAAVAIRQVPRFSFRQGS